MHSHLLATRVPTYTNPLLTPLLLHSVDELHERLKHLEEELQQARQRADVGHPMPLPCLQPATPRPQPAAPYLQPAITRAQARQRADPDTATSSLGLPLKGAVSSTAERRRSFEGAVSVSSDVTVNGAT